MKRKTQKQLCVLLSLFMLISLFASSITVRAAETQKSNVELAQSINTAVAKDIEGHWAQKQISDWNEKGFIKGYSDNTFKPDKTITRAEFITLVNNIFGYNEKSNTVFQRH